MEAIRSSLTTKLGNDDCNIIFGELVGMNIAGYNGTRYPDQQQDLLNGRKSQHGDSCTKYII